jgi:hypothetical protein
LYSKQTRFDEALLGKHFRDKCWHCEKSVEFYCSETGDVRLSARHAAVDASDASG